MGLLQKIKAIWQKVSLIQRALLIAVVLTFIIVGALLTHWASRPDMRMLYHELSPEEASKITEKIHEKNISYELRNGGTSIYVPKEKIYQLRLDMAKEGLPAGEQGGYKIFDSERIGVSPLAQKVNLKRALQEELAKSIQMIDGVAYARVHIVSSEQTLFTSDAGSTTASVVLRLNPGYRLSALNVAAITHLVSGSVEELSSENVTVIDSQGRLLSGESDQSMASGANSAQDYRDRVEQNLADKVEAMLTTVLGPGRAVVRVSAVIDMNSVNIVAESYDPKKKVVTKETEDQRSEKPSVSSGEGESVAAGSEKKDKTTVTEYAVSKTVKQEVILPGEIRSLTVAAFVDLSVADANEAEAGGQTAMTTDDVKEIIKNALGIENTDAIKVVDRKFHRPAEALIGAEEGGGLDFVAIARHASLGIMAICALLVLRMFSGAKKKVKAAAAAGELTEAEGAAGLFPAGAENAGPLVLRRQIAGALESNPEQVKQLFSSWLEEKED